MSCTTPALTPLLLLPLVLLCTTATIPALAQPQAGAPWPQFSTHGRWGWRAATLSSSFCPASAEGGRLIASGDVGFMTDASPAVSSDGIVYVTTRVGALVALDSTANFSVVWTFTIPSGLYCSSSPAIDASGLVFTGCGDSTLYAVFASNGTLAWSYSMRGTVNAPVALAGDGTLFVGSLGGDFVALEAASGTVKWVADLSYVWYSAAVGRNGLVYVADINMGLLALDQASGKIVWQKSVGEDHPYPSPAIAPNGYVIWGTHEGTVLATHPTTGEEMWRTVTGYDMTSLAVTPLGLVIFGDLGNAVRALDARTGRSVWNTTSGDQVQSAPIISLEGTVYAGCNDGKLYAMCSLTGALKWVFQADSPFVSSAPAIGKKGEVFIASSSGKLYSVSCGKGKGDMEGRVKGGVKQL